MPQLPKKKVNLLTLHNLLEDDEGGILDASTKRFLGIEALKDREISLIIALCRRLKAYENYHHLCKEYYLNYKIPQIGKEFDIIRIGTENLINIEIKSEVDEVKILNQLRRNYYYLSFLGKSLNCFAFVKNESGYLTYWYSNADDRIRLVDFGVMVTIILGLVDVGDVDI